MKFNTNGKFLLKYKRTQWLFRLHHNHGTNYHTIYIFHFICCSCWRVCICNQLYYTIYFTLISIVFSRPSWSWSYGSWIYHYLCNPCLSSLNLWVPIQLMATCTRYNSLSVTGRWFSLGPPVFSTNKTDRHDITEILLRVALKTTNQPTNPLFFCMVFMIQKEYW